MSELRVHASETATAAEEQAKKLVVIDAVEQDELFSRLRHLEMRGVYDESGLPVKPYKNARFKVVQVLPPSSNEIGDSPIVRDGDISQKLWTPQPTVYEDQLFIMDVLDRFLNRVSEEPGGLGPVGTDESSIGLSGLTGALLFEWPNKGRFHVMPPLIEHHQYQLTRGAIDLEHIRSLLTGCFVKDAIDTLHPLSAHDLKNYYVDHQTCQEHMPIFNPTINLLNYGRQQTGTWEATIICDGSHRITHAIEEKGAPINAVLVEPEEGSALLPYYAVPRNFHPATRLTSKRAEVLYKALENDKIHLFNDLIRKVAHYDWENSGLHVSSLRSKDKS